MGVSEGGREEEEEEEEEFDWTIEQTLPSDEQVRLGHCSSISCFSSHIQCRGGGKVELDLFRLNGLELVCSVF